MGRLLVGLAAAGLVGVGVLVGVLLPDLPDSRPLFEDELGAQCATYYGAVCDKHTPVDDIVFLIGEDR